MGGKSGKLFLRAGEVGFSLNLRPGWVSVRRKGGSQLREQASQDPSAECAHIWGVRGDTEACWGMVGEECAWNMLVLWVELCPQKI